jgi:hypothetical protein
MPEFDRALEESAFVFVGTVEHVGAAATDVPSDERTAVVMVEAVLHAPSAFAQLTGTRVTLQPDPELDRLQPGEQWTFFANGLAFGESIALAEVARHPVAAVEPHLAQAAAEGHEESFGGLRRQLADTRLRQHAAEADAVVLGRVIGLERAVLPSADEHDPHWWRATIDVRHVERGDVQVGPLAVLYPNSRDVRWYAAPKPNPGTDAAWILHATEGGLAELAPYQLLHREDQQPLQGLDVLRASRDDEGDT